MKDSGPYNRINFRSIADWFGPLYLLSQNRTLTGLGILLAYK